MAVSGTEFRGIDPRFATLAFQTCMRKQAAEMSAVKILRKPLEAKAEQPSWPGDELTAINGNLHASMCTVRQLHIFWITGLLPDSISSRAHLILQSSQESRSSHCLIKGLRRPASHHGL